MYEDALLEGYLNQLVKEKAPDKEEMASLGNSTRKQLLSAINQYLYDFLTEKITLVANGEVDSAIFETGYIDLSAYTDKTVFTKEELDTTDLNSQEAMQEALSSAGIDVDKLFSALLSDHPYELYWFDKTAGFGYAYSVKSSVEEDQLHIQSVSYRFTMSVSADYSKTGSEGTSDINTAKTGMALKTVERAQAVVNSAVTEGCASDYDKLKYYKEYICGEVSYDYDAAKGNISYGDPWQVISVFDSDASTNVVCEGYSKAFKMLCDLSSFTYQELDCYLMTGNMSVNGSGEAHMWNVVHMDDDKNYLVDVTNCDTGYDVEDNRLFMVGYTTTDSSGYSVYRDKLFLGNAYTIPDTVAYVYDQGCLSEFTVKEREISSSNYSRSVVNVTVTLDENGGICDIKSLTVQYGSTYGGLPVPIREGCSFAGWFTEKEGGTRVLSSTKVTNLQAHTLYAHWADASDVNTGDLTFRGEDFWVDDCGYKILTENTVSFVNGLRLERAKVTIPSKVTYDGKGYTVVSIGGAAFSYEAEWALRADNEWLEEVIIPDTVIETEDLINSNWNYHGAFSSCVNLKKVSLSGALQKIGSMSFAYCGKLEMIELPDSIIEIGANAFEGSGLTKINVPAKCKNVVGLLFADQLKEINVDTDNKTYYSVDGVLYKYRDDFDPNITSSLFIYPPAREAEVFSVPEGTKTIGINSFFNNTYLKKVILPGSLEKDSLFEGVMRNGVAATYNVFQGSAIEEISIVSDNSYYTSKDGVLYSKDMKTLVAYPPAKKDKIFFVPGMVERLGGFNDNEILEELYIPASVNYILDGSTTNMKNLKKLVFAEKSVLEMLTSYMTLNNFVITDICIPANVKSYNGWQVLCGNKLEKIYFAKGAVWNATETKDLASHFPNSDSYTIYGHGTANGLPELVNALKQSKPGVEYVDVDKTQIGELLGLTFEDTVIKLEKGEQKNAGVYEYPYHIDGVSLKYETSDPKVAAVDEEGNIEAKGRGVCYITVSTSEGKGEYARCLVEVEGGSYVGDPYTWIIDETTGKKQYVNSEGEIVKAQKYKVTIPEETAGTYYFDEQGYMATGLVKITGKVTYYADETSGRLQTGFKKDSEGKLYYFDPGTLEVRTGSDTELSIIGENYYVIGADGIITTSASESGYTQDEKSGFYINKDGEAAVAKLFKIGKKQYLADAHGRMVTYADTVNGKITIAGQTYTVDKDTNEAAFDRIYVYNGHEVEWGRFDTEAKSVTVIFKVTYEVKEEGKADTTETINSDPVIAATSDTSENVRKLYTATYTTLDIEKDAITAEKVFDTESGKSEEYAIKGKPKFSWPISIKPDSENVSVTVTAEYTVAEDGQVRMQSFPDLQLVTAVKGNLTDNKQYYKAVYIGLDGKEYTGEWWYNSETGKHEGSEEEVIATTWNLFYIGGDNSIDDDGDKIPDRKQKKYTVSNKDLKADDSNEFFKAHIENGVITVSYLGAENEKAAKKAIGTKYTTFHFAETAEGNSDLGKVDFTVPVEFVVPTLKIDSTNAMIFPKKTGGTNVTIKVLYMAESGIYEPLQITEEDVLSFGNYKYDPKVNPAGNLISIENGEITLLNVNTAISGGISIKKSNWIYALNNLKFNVKESKKHVVNTGFPKNTVIINKKAVLKNDEGKEDYLAYYVRPTVDGMSISEWIKSGKTNIDNGEEQSRFSFVVDEKASKKAVEAGIFTYDKESEDFDPDTVIVKYQPGAKGSYTVRFLAKDADDMKGSFNGTVSLVIKISEKGLEAADKAATVKIQRKLDVVTKASMILVPTLKEISGTIVSASLKDGGPTTVARNREDKERKSLFVTEYDHETGNIEISHNPEAADFTAADFKTKYNMTLILAILVNDIDQNKDVGNTLISVPVELKNIELQKTTPIVRTADVVANGNIVTANIVSLYKDKAKATHVLLPDTEKTASGADLTRETENGEEYTVYKVTASDGKEVRFVKDSVRAGEDGTISLQLDTSSMTKKSDTLKVTIEYPCGVIKKNISIKVRKS